MAAKKSTKNEKISSVERKELEEVIDDVQELVQEAHNELCGIYGNDVHSEHIWCFLMGKLTRQDLEVIRHNRREQSRLFDFT